MSRGNENKDNEKVRHEKSGEKRQEEVGGERMKINKEDVREGRKLRKEKEFRGKEAIVEQMMGGETGE